MSNLGDYQKMTIVAKKVGGPKNLAGIIAGAGVVVGVALCKGREIVAEKVSKKMNKGKLTGTTDSIVYSVTVDGVSDDGLEFKIGDQFRVLETDKDAVLIEKIGDDNNPYFVSVEFLEMISNYKRYEDSTMGDFSYVTSSWLDTASEDELRDTASEMESLLEELDYYSDEYTKISNIHIDVVNAISSRFPLNLPHREHGWYLSNDD